MRLYLLMQGGGRLSSPAGLAAPVPMTTITLSDIPKKRSIALILSPVGLVLLSAARLIIVADYNTTTAVTIASSGGYINAFLGSVIPLIPVFAPYLALLLLLMRRFLLSIVVFIFAAFITPTPLTLPQLGNFARADWHQLQTDWHQLALVSGGPWQLIAAILLLIVLLLIIGPFWVYHRSAAEVTAAVLVMILTAGVLFTTHTQLPSLPATLRTAYISEGHNEHHLATFSVTYWPLLIGIALALLILFSSYSNFPAVLATIVAVVATFALAPYVYDIYPVPRQGTYYSEVLHELWLPAEKIITKSGRVYYGYILSSDTVWDTVLQTNRTIIYLHEDNVARRSVCLPKTTPQPALYPPLIPLLYSPPTPTPSCANRYTPITIESTLSYGQSLKSISSTIHVRPRHILYITNAHSHDHISQALRTYELKQDWNAPTPIGQRFWYYPWKWVS